ncbi:MAG: C10 family peptidase [Bacteroidetes bacterium]|nr:C10 family peptidase [Bacteroidota bacterium]
MKSIKISETYNDMKKITTLLTMALLLVLIQIQASGIDVKLAKTVAHNFYFKRNFQNVQIDYNAKLVSDVYPITTQSETVIYFINYKFGGWVMVSATDAVIPIIAYSFKGKYNPDFVPENFKAWLSQYKSQIYETIRDNVQTPNTTISLWEYYLNANSAELTKYKKSRSVEPLIVTNWDQGLYYNEMCPADPGGPGRHCLTGCVPTCMAQICNYFRFPQTGTGSYSYDCPPYGELSVDFSEANYNWDEMPSSLSTNSLETAQIMYHLGVSCDIVYGPDGSGMYNHKAAYALRIHFKYSQETEYLYRDSTNLNWDSVIIAHLDKKIPLYYAGWSVPNINGHAFVCDGYEDSAYFHFNWGWSGSNDGYFYTSNLNPGGNNFNLAQELIINCFPDTLNYQYPMYCMGTDTLTSTFGTIDDGSGPVYNYIDNQVCSWLISPIDSVNSITINFINFETELFDTLFVFNGDSDNNQLLGSFSGNSIPNNITSTGDNLFIKFKSDNENTADGWLIGFSSEIPQFCSNNVITEANGEISDGSGPANYQNLTTCLWMIQPTSGDEINLEFSSFNTEEDHDFVTIYDGSDKVGEFSGNELPPNITAVNGMMTIVFSTNSSITEDGWEASYTTTITDVDESNIKDIIVFPNPAYNELNIELSNDSEVTNVKLYSLLGKEIISKQIVNSKSVVIDTSELPDGMYIIDISTKENSTSKKILIQH